MEREIIWSGVSIASFTCSLRAAISCCISLTCWFMLLLLLRSLSSSLKMEFSRRLRERFAHRPFRSSERTGLKM